MSIFNNNLNTFGLDLSDRTIKVAQLRRNGDKLKLAGYNREEIPEGIIMNGEIKKGDELAKIIKKTVSESKPRPISAKFVVYSIPETKGFIRVIRLPEVKKENMVREIAEKSEQFFPISIKDSYFDWQVLLQETKNKEVEVLVAAAPQEIIDSYSKVFKKAGLEPVAAEIESIAIARSLINQRQSSRPVLIIDLGKDRTSFIIFKKPVIQFTASIPICGNEFNKAIAKEFSVSTDEAEKIKLECGLNRQKRSSRAYKAMLPSLVELVKYISKLLDYYQEHFSPEFYSEIQGESLELKKSSRLAEKDSFPISKVIVCGGEAKIPGMDFYLSLQIKKEIERGNPWINIISSGSSEIPPISRENSLIFVTVLGLAMREVGED